MAEAEDVAAYLGGLIAANLDGIMRRGGLAGHSTAAGWVDGQAVADVVTDSGLEVRVIVMAKPDA